MNSRYTLTIALLSIATLSFADPVASTQKNTAHAPISGAPMSRPSLAVPNLPVCFVEIARIMTPNVAEAEALEWREAAQALQADLEGKYAKISAEQESYQKARAELENPAKNKWSSEESRDSKAQALVVKEAEITSEIKNLQKYHSRAVQKLQMDMHENIKKAAKEIRVQRNIGCVLPADITLDVDPKVDITKDVIDLLNKEYEAKKKSAEKGAVKPALPAAPSQPTKP